MKNDQRVIITKKMLKEGLLTLLKKKDLNKITITDLCTQSGINRATFYRHYEEPKDILNEIRYSIFEDIKNIQKQLTINNSLDILLEKVCEYFYENKDLLNILFKYRNDEDFVALINEICKQRLPYIRKQGYMKEYDDESLQLSTYYFAGGIYYILRQWLSQYPDKSPEEIAHIIHNALNIA
ncbi:MAG: TetR-like C-terminal domain-containing protein [Erysipelotrichaceae bacterium]|nr:TetR family transcriptional regulator C-terminal domain-containing protein [Solobacterium sp.]MDY2730727.1 TetR-like C-terminal domain-containing protein [Erysipelotrichaceae bacterium]MCI7732324.1 TetR family transcriptional regulator C-terminal domain-containing protein [Solobacterium sp.]MDD6956283.1 TetR-like C-terminal domain-containing protein [Solobacterium sp.]MDY4641275.1 TetR-like C-terminal domain-containing protein [Erysipelotrichaceae bacterium]